MSPVLPPTTTHKQVSKQCQEKKRRKKGRDGTSKTRKRRRRWWTNTCISSLSSRDPTPVGFLCNTCWVAADNKERERERRDETRRDEKKDTLCTLPNAFTSIHLYICKTGTRFQKQKNTKQYHKIHNSNNDRDHNVIPY